MLLIRLLAFLDFATVEYFTATMAVKETASEPHATPSDSVGSSPSSQSLRATLQALRYDHSSQANTGNVPPITVWQELLMGKKWVAEHRDVDENVSCPIQTERVLYRRQKNEADIGR